MGSDDLTGQVLHETYRIEQRIGRGGNGEVYAASHLRIERRFAVKVLLPAAARDANAIERFEREARVTSAIGNPHIVEVVDSYRTANGRPYLVMELLDGEDLAEYYQRKGRLEPFEVGAILQQAANGLEAAHLQGVIHRDLKPQNLFLCNTERGHRLVKILDFGTSKILGNPREMSQHALLGTPHYMAPEQAASRAGAISARTDVYALGVIVFELLAGEMPFKSTALFSLLYEIVRGTTPSLKICRPDLPDDICRVVDKAMRKDPGQRHASVAALSRHFSAAVMRSEEADQEQTYTWDRFYELAARGSTAEPALRSGEIPEAYEATVRAREADLIVTPPPVSLPVALASPDTDPLGTAAPGHGGRAAHPPGPTRVVRPPTMRAAIPPGASSSAPEITAAVEDTDSITDRDTESGASVSSGLIAPGPPPRRGTFGTRTPPLREVISGELTTSAEARKPSSNSPASAPRPGGGTGVVTPVASTSPDSVLFAREQTRTPVEDDGEATIAWSAPSPPQRPAPRAPQLTPRPTAVVDHTAPQDRLSSIGGPLIAAALLAALLVFAGSLWAVCGLQGEIPATPARPGAGAVSAPVSEEPQQQP